MNERDDLISAVHSGRMSPEEAQAEAARLGLPPLEGPADRDALEDPARMRFWTLPMTLAWIMWRDLDRVGSFEPGYVEQCGRWVEHRTSDGLQWLLTPLDPPTLRSVEMRASLEALEDGAPSTAASYAEAIETLSTGLRSGSLEAIAVDVASGRRGPIPTDLWSIATPSGDWGEEMSLEAGNALRRFRQVRVARSVVMSLWRPPLAAEWGMHLPPPIAPDGLGEMPLFQAALWIATDSGQITFHPEAPTRWKEAYEKLLAAIVGGLVKASGVRDGMREPIPGVVFSGIAVAYPYEQTPLDLVMSDEFILQSTP